MGQISDIQNPWRQILLSQPAKFRGVAFHVESGSGTSGRRTVMHEYPKRNVPYAEDMGRHAKRFTFSGYLIHRVNPLPGFSEYTAQRIKLVKALEDDDAGMLIHPVFCPGSGMMVMCERYSMSENRERGGYTQFEMQFVQAGAPGNSAPQTDGKGKVDMTAKTTEQAAVDTTNVTIDEAQRTAIGMVAATAYTPTNAEQKIIDEGIHT